MSHNHGRLVANVRPGHFLCGRKRFRATLLDRAINDEELAKKGV